MCTETEKRALVVVMTLFSRLHLMRQNHTECHNPQPANQNTVEKQILCDIRVSDSGTEDSSLLIFYAFLTGKYEGWNFNSGNYLFTTDTK